MKEKEEPKKLSLYEKIQAVSNEVRNIEKNMQVGSGSYGYKAVSDLDVVLAIKDAEKKFRLVSIPVKQELVHSEIVKVAKANTEAITYVDIVKMTTRIVDLDEPTAFVEVESFGRGLDPGDKGFGKASTYARKYALLNAYKIATGEDPDKNKSEQEYIISEDEKRQKVKNYLLNNNEYLQKIYRALNVGNIDDISDKHVYKLYEDLKTKGRI